MKKKSSTDISQSKKSEFEQIAADSGDASFAREMWEFLKQNKKWWLLPIIILFCIFGVLILLTNTGLAPFIYTLF